MARLLPQILPKDDAAAKATVAAGYQEECLDNMMRKIGFVAACIDLHDWRTIIDEVLDEVEAANERAMLLETALHGRVLPPHTPPATIHAPSLR
jgi:hypothetical protein